MKKLLVMILLFFSIMTANAQLVKVSFGIKGQGIASLMNTEIKPSTYVQLGGGGGAFLGMKVGRVIGLQVEGLYSYQNASFAISDKLGNNIWNSTQQYLYVPAVLQLWCGRSFAFEFGYQQAIALSGTLSSSGNVKDDTGILDYGSLVAGMNINMGKVAFLSFRYTHAMQYSYVMTKDPSKCMSLQVGLGFRFFTSRKSVFVK